MVDPMPGCLAAGGSGPRLSPWSEDCYALPRKDRETHHKNAKSRRLHPASRRGQRRALAIAAWPGQSDPVPRARGAAPACDRPGHSGRRTPHLRRPRCRRRDATLPAAARAWPDGRRSAAPWPAARRQAVVTARCRMPAAPLRHGIALAVPAGPPAVDSSSRTSPHPSCAIRMPMQGHDYAARPARETSARGRESQFHN